MDYLDFGTSSESENEDGDEMACEMDSDEEERYENKRLLKMFNLHTPSKNQRNIQDFEAEMEAELDRRALEVESQGGVEHQKSLSRSSSTNSLNKSPRASPVPGTSSVSGSRKSSLKRAHSSESGCVKKSVKFATSTEIAVQSTSGIPTEEKMNFSETKAKKMYDELYFDSDESDEEDGISKERKKLKKENSKRFMTDEELFYDPSSDAKDQEWIDNQRRKSYGNDVASEPANEKISGTDTGNTPNVTFSSSDSGSKPTNSNRNNVPNLPTTDAVLNCPACFTPVCHDCQRHELYVGQYRAMFVVNCLINTNETLNIPEKVPKKFKKLQNKKNQIAFTSNSNSDVFHPVICKICKTQVAMYDSDEVYHFFNVLASQP